MGHCGAPFNNDFVNEPVPFDAAVPSCSIGGSTVIKHIQSTSINNFLICFDSFCMFSHVFVPMPLESSWRCFSTSRPGESRWIQLRLVLFAFANQAIWIWIQLASLELTWCCCMLLFHPLVKQPPSGTEHNQAIRYPLLNKLSLQYHLGTLGVAVCCCYLLFCLRAKWDPVRLFAIVSDCFFMHVLIIRRQ